MSLSKSIFKKTNWVFKYRRGLAIRLGSRGGKTQNARGEMVDGKLAMERGDCFVFSFAVEKRLELVEKTIRYRLDILGVSSTKARGTDHYRSTEGWKIFYPEVYRTCYRSLHWHCRWGYLKVLCWQTVDYYRFWLILSTIED